MSIIKKLHLYFSIKKFYKIFSEVVGANFITELSDMTDDNVMSVAFDIHEVLEGYDYDEADEMFIWLTKLSDKVTTFHNYSFRIQLNELLFNICNTKKHGHYELRPYTTPIYKFAQWLYKKGVI